MTTRQSAAKKLRPDRRIFEYDDETFDERGLLRDGRSVRVRVADHEAVVVEDELTGRSARWELPDGTVATDAEFRDYARLAGKPGPGYGLPSPVTDREPGRAERLATDAQRAVLDAYAEYEARVTDAHRRPPPAAGSSRRSPIGAWNVDDAAAATDEVVARVVRASDVAAHLEDVRGAADAEYRTRLEAASRR